jgi:hypothetical protein
VGGGDIIVRLKEGQETPPGTKIYSLKGFDADGDRLLFGVQKGKDSDLIKVVNQVRFRKYFENLPKNALASFGKMTLCRMTFGQARLREVRLG